MPQERNFYRVYFYDQRSGGAAGARFLGLDATHFAPRSYVAAQPLCVAKSVTVE